MGRMLVTEMTNEKKEHVNGSNALLIRKKKTYFSLLHSLDLAKEKLKISGTQGITTQSRLTFAQDCDANL